MPESVGGLCLGVCGGDDERGGGVGGCCVDCEDGLVLGVGVRGNVDGGDIMMCGTMG